jgi:hypothetical protein
MTGITVTSGMILIVGGNGSILGGQIPIRTIPMIGRVIVMHNGFGNGTGHKAFVGLDPGALLTVVLLTAISSVVSGGIGMVVVIPLVKVVNGGGVQVVVVVNGGNMIVQG